MEIYEIQNIMKSGEKPKMLVFYGSDYELINVYINNISKFYAINKSYIEDISRLPQLCVGDQMFYEDKLFIVKYPKDLSSYERIFNNINEILGENILIIVLSDLDKRTKFYTQNKDLFVNFEPQDLKTFRTMVKPITNLSPDNVKELASICQNNYGKFLTEIDKVKNYAQANNKDEDESFETLISSGVIYTANKDVIFEFIDRVMSARNNMYELLNILRIQGESNIKIISLLYNSFRNQFICETVNNPNQGNTGISPFIISQCLRRKGIYTQSDLRRALYLLMKIEQGVKSGLFDESQVIDYFIIQLLL